MLLSYPPIFLCLVPPLSDHGGWVQNVVAVITTISVTSPAQHSTSHPGPDHHHFVITFLRLSIGQDNKVPSVSLRPACPHPAPADTLSSPPGYRVQS